MVRRAIRKVRQFRRQFYCAAALAPVFAVIYFLGFWLRFESLQPEQWSMIAQTIIWVVLTKLVVFGRLGVFGGWSRYVTFHDLVALVQAATVSSLVLLLCDYMLYVPYSVPRSIFLMDWGATIVVIGGLRAATRLLQERGRLHLLSSGKVPVFIVGANDPGEALLRSIRRNERLPYDVVGFIDDDHSDHQLWIGGVPVLGTLEQTCELAERHGVHNILITAGELSGKQLRQLVDDGRQLDIHFQVLPSYEQMLKGNVAFQPRSVSIEDLLRRDPVQLDFSAIGQWIDGRVVMVTGSAGSIGSEICRQLLRLAPQTVVLVDRSENGQFFLERELEALVGAVRLETCIADITDETRMRTVFDRYRPDIVFHAAAYKHVPLMEANPGEAVKNIVLATRSLARLAEQSGVESFVMISTDKAVNPSSVMGVCKRVAELVIQTMADGSRTRFVTVRFGNVLDSAGSVVPIFRQQIAAGGPVTVTDPRVERYFMTIPEASQLVIQAGAMGWGGEVFVLDMGERVRIVDLAKDMIRLSGLRVGEDIEVKFVGLRPGEKMVEDLHSGHENQLPTPHPKITLVEGQPCDGDEIRSAVRRLETVIDAGDEAVIAELQTIVPEYRRSAATRAVPQTSGRTNLEVAAAEPGFPAPSRTSGNGRAEHGSSVSSRSSLSRPVDPAEKR